MLYTTYLANLKNLPKEENNLCILVTRWKPRNSINTDKYNILWRPNLGPSETLLTRWKSNNMTWKEYRKTYLEEANNNKIFMDGIKEIVDLSKEYDNIFLVCYEKEDFNCHRSILREILNYNDMYCKEY